MEELRQLGEAGAKCDDSAGEDEGFKRMECLAVEFANLSAFASGPRDTMTSGWGGKNSVPG